MLSKEQSRNIHAFFVILQDLTLNTPSFLFEFLLRSFSNLKGLGIIGTDTYLSTFFLGLPFGINLKTLLSFPQVFLQNHSLQETGLFWSFP